MSESSATSESRYPLPVNTTQDGNTPDHTLQFVSQESITQFQSANLLLQKFYKTSNDSGTNHEASNHTISQVSIKTSQLFSAFPSILKFGFLHMEDNFSLAIFIDPGVFQLCDPFSL